MQVIFTETCQNFTDYCVTVHQNDTKMLYSCADSLTFWGGFFYRYDFQIAHRVTIYL